MGDLVEQLVEVVGAENVLTGTQVHDDYTHDDAPRSGAVRLRAGWHPVRLFYRHEPAEFAARLNVAVHGPNFDHDLLSGEMIGCNARTN